jgi:hypothetical protein
MQHIYMSNKATSNKVSRKCNIYIWNVNWNIIYAWNKSSHGKAIYTMAMQQKQYII